MSITAVIALSGIDTVVSSDATVVSVLFLVSVVLLELELEF